MRTPKYRKHSTRDLGFIETKGRRIYFPGSYNSPASLAAYYAAISDLVSGKQPERAPADDPGDLTVEQVCALYQAKRMEYHGKNKFYTVKSAIRVLSEQFGPVPMKQLQPRFLLRIQEVMLEKDLSRRYINECVSYIKVVVRWARLMDFATAEQVMSLETVENLKPHKSKAREPADIRPVEEWVVMETCNHVRAPVANLLRFMLHTGARPGEARLLTPAQIDRSDDVWVYRPDQHKNAHRGKARAIAIGPKAKSVLLPLMFRDASMYCFPSSEKRNSHYTKDTLNQAIERGVTKANKREGATRLPIWNANQLRHTVATKLREELGIEAAQNVLGHTSLNTTQIYAERSEKSAKEVARRLG